MCDRSGVFVSTLSAMQSSDAEADGAPPSATAPAPPVAASATAPASATGAEEPPSGVALSTPASLSRPKRAGAAKASEAIKQSLKQQDARIVYQDPEASGEGALGEDEGGSAGGGTVAADAAGGRKSGRGRGRPPGSGRGASEKDTPLTSTGQAMDDCGPPS